MALTAFEVFGVLKLDTTQFNKSLDDAKGHVTGISKAAGLIGGGLATAAKAGVTAIGAASTAIVGFSKTSVDQAVSFESAFTGVKKTVDATAGEYEQLSSWIMDASTRMASSKEEIAGTMEIAGQLGIRGVDGLEKFTETMIMLGDTTNLNAEDAASALAQFGNIAGVGAEDMDRIGSTIVDLGNHFATTEVDIVNMATRLASAGTIAGLSSTDILALSTAMSSVGINAEAGGTAMSQTLTTISKATELAGTAADEEGKWATKLEKLGEVAGMSGDEFRAAWGADTVGTLSKFITGLTNAEANGKSALVLLDDLGMTGIRQSNMLQSLSLANETLSGAIGMANTAFEENTALQNEANTRYSTTESQMIQTKEAFKNLQVTVGKELMPTMSDFFSYSQSAIKDISKGLEEGGIEGMVSAVGTAISDALTEITEKMPQAIDLGIKLLSALGQGLIDNAPQIFSSLAEVGGLILSTITDGFWKTADAIGSADFAGFADKIGKVLTDLFDSENGGLAGLGYAASRIIQNLGNGLSEAIPTIVPYINTLITDISDFIVQEAPGLIDSGVNLITSLVSGMSETLPTLIPTAMDTLLTVIQDFLNGDGLNKIADAAVTLATNLADGVANAIPVIAEKLPDILWQLLMGIVDNYPKFFEAAVHLWSSLGSALLSTTDPLVEMGGNVLDVIIGGLLTGLSKVQEFGGNLIESIKTGVTEKIESIKETFTGLWTALIENPMIQNFVDDITTSFNLISEIVTGVWETIKNIVLGAVLVVCDLVTGNFDQLQADVEGIWTNITNAVTSAWDGIKNLVINSVTALVNGVKTIFTKWQEWNTTISNAIKDFIVNAWDTIKTKVVTTATNLVSGVRTKVAELPGIIKTKFDEAVSFIKDLPGKALTWGRDMIGEFIKGFKQKIQDLKDGIEGVADTIRGFLHFSEPDVGPLADFHTYAPDMMKLFAEGIKDNTGLITDQIQKSFDFSDVIADQNVNVNGSVRESEARTPGSVVINVYGAEGQDINALADEISYRLQHLYDVRDAVFA